MRILGIICAVCGAAGALPAHAGAAVVSMEDYGYAAVTAAPGERNAMTVTVTPDGRTLIVEDAATPPTAGPGCTVPRHGAVRCEPEENVGGVNVKLGDLDDLATVRTEGVREYVYVSLDAGDGDDRVEGGERGQLAGGPGDDVLRTRGSVLGGPGDDRMAGTSSLRGGHGDDVARAVGDEAAMLSGGPGRDRLVGGPGDDLLVDRDDAVPVRDRYDGGPGIDRVSYADEDEPLRLDLAAGRATIRGATDRLEDIEGAFGTEAGDVLLGDAAANPLAGYRGRDRIAGRGGDDDLAGWSGADRLHGGPGRDELAGSSGRDRLRGGPGPDELRGDTDRDRIVAGRGDVAEAGFGVDRVQVMEPRAEVRVSADWASDRVRCDAPAFAVVAEPGDRIGRACRAVTRVAPPGLLYGDDGDGKPVTLRSDGGLVEYAEVACPASTPDYCRGVATVLHGREVVARQRFASSCCYAALRRLRLAPWARRAVARDGRLPVVVEIRLAVGPVPIPARSTGVIVPAKEDR